MNGFRITLTAVTLCSLTVALTVSGCSKEGARRVAGPARPPGPVPMEFRDARWITAEDELREVTARAGKSPLMAQAVSDLASDPRLSLLKSGIVSAVGTAPDGRVVRFTIFPYQYGNDVNRAVYFVLLERAGETRVESFDLLRNRKPGPGEQGFTPVNRGEHGLWMRSGGTYVQAQDGSVQRAPERFNWAKFAACFIPLADSVLGAVDSGCNSMGNFPGCRAVGSSAGLLGAALYCAFASWNG